MALTRQRILAQRVLAVLVAVLLAAANGACKPPPPHTDSTRGTKPERDTGMHDNPM